MSALQHVRLPPDEAPVLAPRPWFAAYGRDLQTARTLPTLRELVTSDHRTFSSRGLAYPKAAESLVLYLFVVVPKDPALAERFGGRLDRALRLALHGAEREEVADVIVGDDEDELDTAWRAWIRAQ